MAPRMHGHGHGHGHTHTHTNTQSCSLIHTDARHSLTGADTGKNVSGRPSLNDRRPDESRSRIENPNSSHMAALVLRRAAHRGSPLAHEEHGVELRVVLAGVILADLVNWRRLKVEERVGRRRRCGGRGLRSDRRRQRH